MKCGSEALESTFCHQEFADTMRSVQLKAENEVKFKRGEVITYVRKMRNRKREDLEDCFYCLPDELLLCIFNFLPDLKILCQCSVVCKRFASVISHVRTVSITLQSNGVHSIQSYKDMRTLFREMRHAGCDETSAFHKLLSFQELNLPKLLRKFNNLESVSVEYARPRNDGNSSSLLKWKVKCRSNSVTIKSLVALLPASVCRKSEYEPDSEPVNPFEFIKPQIKNCVWLSYGRFVEWQFLSCLLFKCHGSLQHVMITDSEKQGKLVVRDKQIVRPGIDLERDPGKFPLLMKMAWVPVLNLPSSGYVMRDACLTIIDFLTEPGAGLEENGEENIMAWEFEEEEKLFGEAVREILKNHRNKIAVTGRYLPIHG